MADFRAIYHLGWAEALTLPGPEFLALVYRVTVYPGVMAARVAETNRVAHRNVPAGAQVVDGDRVALAADPLLRDVVQIG